jgi:putative transposase
MPRTRHKPEEIIAELRQVDVLASQGQTVADAVRSIGVTEVTYYLYGRLSLCKPTSIRSALVRCVHLSGVTRSDRGAQMGNPLARTSTAGRPCRPR